MSRYRSPAQRSFIVALLSFCSIVFVILQIHSTSAIAPSSALTQSAEPTIASDAVYIERMAREHAGDRPIATGLVSMAPSQAVVTQEVEYATVNDSPVIGYLARPENATEPLPGIIAIHEWWGLNDNIKAIAERLAGEGYSVLAVDLFGGTVTGDPDEARATMQAAMEKPGRIRANLRQAYGYLTETEEAPTVGSIGWCFGGGWSLQTALLFPNDLDAAVIYYGRLETDPGVLNLLNVPIAGFFGALDRGIPVREVRRFQGALEAMDKSVDIHIYDDADHAFANPSGQRYQAEAAEDAWEKTVAFFADTLKRE